MRVHNAKLYGMACSYCMQKNVSNGLIYSICLHLRDLVRLAIQRGGCNKRDADE